MQHQPRDNSTPAHRRSAAMRMGKMNVEMIEPRVQVEDEDMVDADAAPCIDVDPEKKWRNRQQEQAS